MMTEQAIEAGTPVRITAHVGTLTRKGGRPTGDLFAPGTVGTYDGPMQVPSEIDEPGWHWVTVDGAPCPLHAAHFVAVSK